ncbi:hypothetical protein LJC08_00320 [Methanimicrococcus sp. OttesenSCG-928-J09]|nr:hypothetical protein [Methanimicrococcus sp. OttesenSCG-928-J09]
MYLLIFRVFRSLRERAIFTLPFPFSIATLPIPFPFATLLFLFPYFTLLFPFAIATLPFPFAACAVAVASVGSRSRARAAQLLQKSRKITPRLFRKSKTPIDFYKTKKNISYFTKFSAETILLFWISVEFITIAIITVSNYYWNNELKLSIENIKISNKYQIHCFF